MIEHRKGIAITLTLMIAVPAITLIATLHQMIGTGGDGLIRASAVPQPPAPPAPPLPPNPADTATPLAAEAEVELLPLEAWLSPDDDASPAVAAVATEPPVPPPPPTDCAKMP